jgi:hypothetical protein
VQLAMEAQVPLAEVHSETTIWPDMP